MSTSFSITREISERLAAVRKKQLYVQLQSQAGFCLAAALTLMGSAVLAELLFRFPSGVRTALVLVSLALFMFLFLRFILRPFLRVLGIFPSWDDFEIARRVGLFFPPVQDRLLNLLQLRREAEHGTRYSVDLINASFRDLAEIIQQIDFLDSVSTAPVKRSFRNLLLSVVATLFLVAVSPRGISESMYRLARYDEEFIPPVRYLFAVAPGNKEVVKGERVLISVKVTEVQDFSDRVRPDELHLRWRLEDQLDFQEGMLRPDSAGVFHTVLNDVRLTTEYFAEFHGIQSEQYRLTVIDRPVLRALQVRLEYPPYTKLPPKVQEEFIGDITAPAGTRVSLAGQASKNLRHGSLVFGNGTTAPLTTRGNRFSARFILTRETDYHVEIMDDEELQNLDPLSYKIKLLPDEHPTAAIVRPGRNLDVAGTSALPMLIQAKDDFGVSRLRIGYRLVQSRFEPPWEQQRFVDIPLPRDPSAQVELSYSWDLSRLKLVPEDVVEYFLEAFDNDAVRGPKNGRSTIYLLRLPSLEEVFTDLDRGHEQAAQDLKQALDDAKDLKDKIESINQDLKKNKDLDWQKQKKLEETAKKYQELQQKLDQVQSKLDNMTQQMQQQQVLSPETMEKYLELQQMFEQLNSAELQKALRQMQQAMQNINRDQLQQALQQITFSEERFRQSIERTLNLLKRIQIEQKLDEVKKRAEELAGEQRQLAAETAQSENDPRKQEELARKQEELRKKLDLLQDASRDLQSRMEEFFTEMPADKLKELNQALQDQQLGQKMNHAADQMRSSQMAQARQLQQAIQQPLQNFAEQMQALQQAMLQQQAQQVMNEMRKAIDNLLELSKREESLKEQSRTAPQGSPQLRQNAQDQMRVMQDLASVIATLNELAKRSFVVTPEMGKSIGEAMAKMQNAMRALDFRSGGTASNEQAGAMGALNKAAMSVQNALQALLQQGGGGAGGGLLGQLQGLAGQQMSLNARTQQVAEQAARLAVEQEAIRKSLEQLSKEAQSSGEQQRLLGDLERIAEEMKEVVKNLEQNDVNPETTRKQERILSRLLDAARSTRERDFEKKRKAQAGTEAARRTPSDLDAETLEGRSRLREDLLKAIEQGYSKDYQELIRKYFEELQKIER